MGWWTALVVNVSQKREYIILEKEKKVALYRFAEGRERERKEYTTAVQEQVSRHKVKHRNGTKKERIGYSVLCNVALHTCTTISTVRSSLLFVPYFLLDRLKM